MLSRRNKSNGKTPQHQQVKKEFDLIAIGTGAAGSNAAKECRTQYPDRCQPSSDCVHSTAPRGLGNRVVPRDHVLATDWIRNGKRLIRETRQSIVRTSLSYVHCAVIQFSDPVNLTDTSEMKIRKGFPSAVPWWSVEIRRGPAFL